MPRRGRVPARSRTACKRDAVAPRARGSRSLLPGKSSVASTKRRSSTTLELSSLNFAEKSPCSERMAQRAACVVVASIKSMTPSACAKIELAVQESAPGEFAGLREARAELDAALEQHPQDHRPAVPLQLEDVFARVGMRRRENRAQCPRRSLRRSASRKRERRAPGASAPARQGHGRARRAPARTPARCRCRRGPAPWRWRRWCRG